MCLIVLFYNSAYTHRWNREMEDIEDETDLREQIFHNNVREQIVSL